jgi:hypothetical protein
MTGIPKVAGAKLMRDTAEHFQLPAASVRGIGALEVAGSVGLTAGRGVEPGDLRHPPPVPWAAMAGPDAWSGGV